MSMPSIPNMNPTIAVTRDDSINIILSSIGMEELSLAHIVNAEAEKIQFALGTLETSDGAASLEDIMAVNASAKRMLRDVIKNQMLIGMKMEDTVDFASIQADPTPSKTAPDDTKQPAAAQDDPAPAKDDPAPQDDPATADDTTA